MHTNRPHNLRQKFSTQTWMCHRKTTIALRPTVIQRQEVVLPTFQRHQTKITFIRAVRIQCSTKVVWDSFDASVSDLFEFQLKMDLIDSELGDPSLASAFNSRYNGSLSQHQGIIYDSNPIQQSASPVPQVYTSGCKSESSYWHQAPEYNVNAVSSDFDRISRHFFLRLGILSFFSLFNYAQIAFIIADAIWSNDCAGQCWRLCGKWCIMAITARFVRSSAGSKWWSGMCELLNIPIGLLASRRWSCNVPSVLVYPTNTIENYQK